MDDPEYLIIVRRGEIERFRVLATSMAGEAVRVMWDRRVGERRARQAPAAPERRRQDRRAPPPPSWETLDFVVAESRTVAPATAS